MAEANPLVDVVLVLKLTLVPALILVASFVGTKWGPAVSGWLVSLPFTSAPVIFFLALEQGDGFASAASEGVTLGLASIAVFAFAYCWFALRRQELAWFSPLLLGWGAYFVLTFILEGVSVPLVAAFLGVVVFLALVNRVLPRPRVVAASSQRLTGSEIAIRMVAATALVLLITESSTTLGPQLSGLLTPFPIYVSVMSASIYRVQGPPSAVHFVRGTTLGLFTPAVFFLIVGTTIVGLGMALSFGLAITSSLLTHGLSFRLLEKGA